MFVFSTIPAGNSRQKLPAAALKLAIKTSLDF
jgi:hypothetical protein